MFVACSNGHMETERGVQTDRVYSVGLLVY